MTEAPEVIYAWSFKGWDWVGGQFGLGSNGKVPTMEGTTKYIRADLVEDKLKEHK